MKKALVLALIVAGVSAASASAVQRSTSPTISARSVAACTDGQIAFLGPLTGPVAFLGAEQGNWAKYSLERFNAANGTHFRLKQGDTQLNPKLALTVG